MHYCFMAIVEICKKSKENQRKLDHLEEELERQQEYIAELTEVHEMLDGRYIDSTGTHDCWCEKYLEGLSYVSGGATLQYSAWTIQQYSTSGKDWSCGYCNGNHIGVHHTGADGRAWWKEYLLPSGSYYWEDSRWVDAVYETQYRYAAPTATSARSAGSLRGTRVGSQSERKIQIEVA